MNRTNEQIEKEAEKMKMVYIEIDKYPLIRSKKQLADMDINRITKIVDYTNVVY